MQPFLNNDDFSSTEQPLQNMQDYNEDNASSVMSRFTAISVRRAYTPYSIALRIINQRIPPSRELAIRFTPLHISARIHANISLYSNKIDMVTITSTCLLRWENWWRCDENHSYHTTYTPHFIHRYYRYSMVFFFEGAALPGEVSYPNPLNQARYKLSTCVIHR